MTSTEQTSSSTRSSASRVAKWLLEKGAVDDAIAVLCAWAAAGPNDAEAEQLLAEAFRIDPSAALARMTFERMEGIEADHTALDEATSRFSIDEIAKLEREMARPSFRRAQVGFNNNLKYESQVFHVQTEDSGLDKPHVITHLFADGGRVVKSHKRSYADALDREDVTGYVRSLMKAQHMEMVLALRDGKFNAILSGSEVGGMSVLTDPPAVDIRKLTQKKKGEHEDADPQPEKNAPCRFYLHVMRSLTGGPDRYDPPGDDVIIGSAGAVPLVGERFCHPREAVVHVRGGKLWLEDLEGGNGVFLRIRTPVELEFGDEFVIGDQLLQLQRPTPPSDGPDPGPTYFYSAPQWLTSFRVAQILEGGAEGRVLVAGGNTMQIGARSGDLILTGDPLIADAHCLVEEQAGVVVLSDLGSRTGVFVRIRGEHEVVHGDELLVGRTRLVMDLSPLKQSTAAAT